MVVERWWAPTQEGWSMTKPPMLEFVGHQEEKNMTPQFALSLSEQHNGGSPKKSDWCPAQKKKKKKKRENVDLVIIFFFFVIQQQLKSLCIKTSSSHTCFFFIFFVLFVRYLMASKTVAVRTNITTDQSALLDLNDHITDDPYKILAKQLVYSTSVCIWNGRWLHASFEVFLHL